MTRCLKKTPSIVGTYNFLSLHAIFYHSVRNCSFECVVWKKLADYFVVWKLEHISNFFIGRFFYLAVHVRSFNSKTIIERLNSCTTKIIQCAPKLSVSCNAFHASYLWLVLCLICFVYVFCIMCFIFCVSFNAFVYSLLHFA